MVAVQMKTYDAERFSPMMNSSTENCPPSWQLNIPADEGHTDFDSSGFLHFSLYDISYIWFGPFSCILCFVVGVFVSLFKPQDHRELDSRLISPGYRMLFFWCPKKIKKNIFKYYEEVGTANIKGT